MSSNSSTGAGPSFGAGLPPAVDLSAKSRPGEAVIKARARRVRA